MQKSTTFYMMIKVNQKTSQKRDYIYCGSRNHEDIKIKPNKKDLYGENYKI